MKLTWLSTGIINRCSNFRTAREREDTVLGLGRLENVTQKEGNINGS